MKIRAHKGGLAESMATAAEIENEPAEVHAYLESQGIIVDGPVESVWYTPDPRINWRDTHLITVNGLAAAFCDEPLKGTDPILQRKPIWLGIDMASEPDQTGYICPGGTCEKGDELA